MLSPKKSLTMKVKVQAPSPQRAIAVQETTAVQEPTPDELPALYIDSSDEHELTEEEYQKGLPSGLNNEQPSEEVVLDGKLVKETLKYFIDVCERYGCCDPEADQLVPELFCALCESETRTFQTAIETPLPDSPASPTRSEDSERPVSPADSVDSTEPVSSNKSVRSARSASPGPERRIPEPVVELAANWMLAKGRAAKKAREPSKKTYVPSKKFNERVANMTSAEEAYLRVTYSESGGFWFCCREGRTNPNTRDRCQARGCSHPYGPEHCQRF
ncbi:hypothetical protein B0J14DRAFT_668466 [Halenospora varia]|nr:hypothetical protein B0J14DRAFT_668466 [Halenospora varia]